MATVKVPDVEAPTATLCWKQDHASMARCDRKENHSGPCSWESWRALRKIGDIVKEVTKE